jgi:hypothetical protein
MATIFDRPWIWTGVILRVSMPYTDWLCQSSPNDQIVPSDFKTKSCEIETTRAKPAIGTGNNCQSLFFISLTPVCRPHVQTVPSRFSARLSPHPAEIALTSVRSSTKPGVDLWAVVLSPSWPYWLRPHDHTVPSALSARPYQAQRRWLPLGRVPGFGREPSLHYNRCNRFECPYQRCCLSHPIGYYPTPTLSHPPLVPYFDAGLLTRR